MSATARKTLRTPSDLAAAQLVGRDRLASLEQVAARYAVAITPALADLIDPSDPHDPIARQFVPDCARIAHERRGKADDPIGDDAHSPVEGIVHRYPDRVLLKLVNACAIYCRFCFRREMVGPGGKLAPAALDKALAYVKNHPEIWEVILTGGDPLVLSARRLKDVVTRLAAIAHVKVIRVHTRVPVAAPEQVTAALVRALRTGKATFVVLHANHPRELTAQVRAACARLIDAGIPMLAQSVLLRGVNDDAADARRLAARAGRMPDQTLLPAPRRSGTRHGASAHHDRRRPGVDARAARPLFRTLSAELCARYPGRPRQIAIGPHYLSEDGAVIEDFCGRRHAYAGTASAAEKNTAVSNS